MKKKHFGRKLNNQGSSLVLALVTIVFIALLASTVMAVTMSNLTFKRIETMSKRSFYNAETAVDAIYAGLGKTAMNSMNNAYVQELGTLVDNGGNLKDNSAANTEMKYRFIADCLKSLTMDGAGSFAVLKADGTYNAATGMDTVKAYLQACVPSGAADKIVIGGLSSIRACANGSGYEISLCDVTVNYESSQGYFSDITTDFIISYPDITIQFHNNNPTDFLEYCLVADVNVGFGSFHTGAGGTSTTVTAAVRSGIYAGKDLNVNNGSKLTLEGDSRVVAHSNIQVLSRENGSAENSPETSSMTINQSTVWSGGDITLGDKLAQREYSELTASADSNLYVQDDIEFDAAGSRATILGSYYGYGIGNADAANSSIIMNTSYGTLNIQAKVLEILGHAYVDVSSDGSAGIAYETGESVSTKNTQEIYLVLDQYFLKTSTTNVTNPMGTGSLPAADADGKKYSTIIKYDEFDNFFAKDLLDSSQPVILVADNIKNLTYFYYNFKDSEARESYAMAVQTGTLRYHGVTTDVTSNPTWQAEHAVLMRNVKKTFYNPLTSLETGGITGISAAETKILGPYITSMSASTVSVADGGLSVSAAQTESAGIKTALSNMYGMMAKTGIFESIINMGTVNAENTYYDTYTDSSTGETYSLHLTDVQNYSLTAGETQGIIIHTGNGIVSVPHNFKGLILSKGTICVTGDALLETDKTLMDKILKDTPEFAKFFKAYYTPHSASGSNIGTLTYEDFVDIANWRKFDDKSTP